MHQMYLDRMAKHVSEVTRRKLLAGFREETHARDENTNLFDEVSQHVIYYQCRSVPYQLIRTVYPADT